MTPMAHANVNAVFYAETYHPIQAGSIDGTDISPHDNAVYRALLAASTGLYDPTADPKVEGNPYCIVFVGRLARHTTEATLREVMSKYGRVKKLRLVRHIVTGASQGYAFVEYETEKEMRHAYEAAHLITIDGSQVLVDYNRQQLMPGWIPRRMGGGLGGRKESGQLRFGGRDRPFRAPLRPIPHEELQKLGIPLPPEGRYLSRFQLPPLPKNRSEILMTRHFRYESHRSHGEMILPEAATVSESADLKSDSKHRDTTKRISTDDTGMVDCLQSCKSSEAERVTSENGSIKEGGSSREVDGRRRHKGRQEGRRKEHRSFDDGEKKSSSSHKRRTRVADDLQSCKSPEAERIPSENGSLKEDGSPKEVDNRKRHKSRQEGRRKEHRRFDDDEKRGSSSHRRHIGMLDGLQSCKSSEAERIPSENASLKEDCSSKELDDRRRHKSRQEGRRKEHRSVDDDDKRTSSSHKHHSEEVSSHRPRSMMYEDGDEHSRDKKRRHKEDDSCSYLESQA